jgi:hypothetical protein
MVDDAVREVAAFGEHATFAIELLVFFDLYEDAIFIGLLLGEHVVVGLLPGITFGEFGRGHVSQVA